MHTPPAAIARTARNALFIASSPVLGVVSTGLLPLSSAEPAGAVGGAVGSGDGSVGDTAGRFVNIILISYRS